ncbi:ATP-binding protein [Chitinivorax sp. PXF-14]|uniref:AAA family ATPase n=1 Tax=Chitinivorax sp. PXF-14 TaxID=3230488 RepID=UPI003466500F
MSEASSVNVNAVNGIARIGNLQLCQIALTSAMDRSQNLPGLVVFSGPSGWGKSMSAMYVANSARAFYVQAKSAWTKKHFLRAILFEMDINVTPAVTIAEMVDQIGEELAASRRPLIIDEMDHIVDRNMVELVRDLYESSQSPILLIGEEGLPTKLKRWERFHGRVLAWVQAQPVNQDDARALRHIYSRDVDIADDLLDEVLKVAHGSVRRVCVNLDLIQREALNDGLDRMDAKGWKKRPLYTGEAPKRRV